MEKCTVLLRRFQVIFSCISLPFCDDIDCETYSVAFFYFFGSLGIIFAKGPKN